MMAATILVAVLGSIFAFVRGSQVWSSRSSEHLAALSDIRTSLARMSRELREGRQLLYPAPGRKSQSGLGVVNARSETVFYYLVDSPLHDPAAPFDLVREPIGGQKEIVARNVTRFLVTAPDPGPGADPLLVHMLMTRTFGTRSPDGDTGVSLATSAAVRAVRSRCLASRGEGN
jgi:hypothetical protein